MDDEEGYVGWKVLTVHPGILGYGLQDSFDLVYVRRTARKHGEGEREYFEREK